MQRREGQAVAAQVGREGGIGVDGGRVAGHVELVPRPHAAWQAVALPTDRGVGQAHLDRVGEVVHPQGPTAARALQHEGGHRGVRRQLQHAGCRDIEACGAVVWRGCGRGLQQAVLVEGPRGGCQAHLGAAQLPAHLHPHQHIDRYKHIRSVDLMSTNAATNFRVQGL